MNREHICVGVREENRDEFENNGEAEIEFEAGLSLEERVQKLEDIAERFLRSQGRWDNNGGAEIGAELSRYERLKRLQERVEKFEEIAEEIMSTRREYLEHFNRQCVIFFPVALTSDEIRALISAIDPIPKEDLSANRSVLDFVVERFPAERKRYIKKVFDCVYENINLHGPDKVIGLFSIFDFYFKLIL